jgi:deoxycytidine triphosphate deaminase
LRVEIHNALCKLFRLPKERMPTALLAITHERIIMPASLAGEIKLKTTPTRKGLGHPIADWVDPGYEGHLTLMLHAVKEIKLFHGQEICQLVLWPVDGNVVKPYGKTGHYMNQVHPTLAWDKEYK